MLVVMRVCLWDGVAVASPFEMWFGGGGRPCLRPLPNLSERVWLVDRGLPRGGEVVREKGVPATLGTGRTGLRPHSGVPCDGFGARC